MKHEISERLRMLLELHLELSGTTQGQLADYLGLASSAVSRILSGHRQISAEEFIRVKDYFNLTFADLDQALAMSVSSDADIIMASDKKAGSPNGKTIKIEHYNKSEATIILPISLFGPFDFTDKQDICWLRVDDDAMSPTIVKSDVVIINASHRMGTGIFALKTGLEQVSIRRLEHVHYEHDSNGEIIDWIVHIGADNPKFRNYETSAERIHGVGSVLLRMTGNFS